MVTRRASRTTRRGGSFCETLVAESEQAGRSLSQEEVRLFEIHYRLLSHWGRRINLTGLRDEDAIIRRHFLEPIAAADLFPDPGTLLDLGSGNGFPAIPLSVLNPHLELVMVEASERKSAFLREIARESGLKRIRVETRRIRSTADLADLLPCRYLTFRAIRGADFLRRGPPVPILEPGGRAVLFISKGQLRDLEKGGLPGMRIAGSRLLSSRTDSIAAILERA